MLRWYPTPLLQVILELTFVPIAVFSAFAINALSDARTNWVIGPLKGQGASASLFLVIALLALGWLVLFLGWRGGGKGLFKVLLSVWHVGLATAAFGLVLGSGGSLFEGEAIGFTISLQILGPVLTLATLALAVYWVWGDLREGTPDRTVSPFRRKNKFSLGLGAAGTFASAILFWLDLEQMGTIIGILSMIAFREAIRPVNPSRELQKAFTAEGSAPR